MTLEERLERLRNRIVVSMSKKTRKNYPEEEERIIESLMDGINYEKPAFPVDTNKSKGQVEYVNVSEISNGKDKYIVKDVLYSGHFEGVSSIWQYGARIDNKEFQIRKISVQHNDKTFEFTLRKENGTYHEEGDSNSKGDIDRCYAYFLGKHYPKVPRNIDLSDINSIRQTFDNNREIAYFLDKFVIVNNEEKEAYKNHTLTNTNPQEEVAKSRSYTNNKQEIDKNLERKILGRKYGKTNY